FIIAQPSFGSTLTLISGANMTESAVGTIAAPNLRLSGTGPASLLNPNNVNVLAADLSDGGVGSLVFENGIVPLIVGIVDGDIGITTNNSAVQLVADSLDVQQQVNAGTGVVTFNPFS